MTMLVAGIHVEFFNHRTADSVFGKHTLDGFVYDEFGFFGHKFLVLNFFETADVTRMITVVFLFKFLPVRRTLSALMIMT